MSAVFPVLVPPSCAFLFFSKLFFSCSCYLLYFSSSHLLLQVFLSCSCYLLHFSSSIKCYLSKMSVTSICASCAVAFKGVVLWECVFCAPRLTRGWR